MVHATTQGTLKTWDQVKDVKNKVHIVYEFIYMKYSEQEKFTETKTQISGLREWTKRRMEGDFFLQSDGSVMEQDSDDALIFVNELKATELCILK